MWLSEGARDWGLAGRIGCAEVSSMKVYGMSGRDKDSWAIAIICRLEGCGRGQGREMLIDRGQTMKSQHLMPMSLNFVLQTLGVVEMEVR